ncbi:MAG TPA: ABC transporter permease [Candidatus Polarisedimenticolia bacterium]|nr:ABC transporter permease [Candidatus Polarisedimenticolia bacterium]
MKVAAILLDTGRELLYRKTIIVYFGIVTLVLLFFALALQTDVANGAIASLTVAGLQGSASHGGFQMGDDASGEGMGGLTAETFVHYVQLGTAFLLYPLAILMSVFATASLVPRMLEKGTIDLLLSKPITRPSLFLSRYAGGLLTAALNLLYLTVGLAVILGWKTGVWNGGFVLSGLLMSVYFACLLAFTVLAGVLLRSTTVSIMLTAALFFVSLLVRLPHANRDWPLLITSRPVRFLSQAAVETLYYSLPRSFEFVQSTTSLIRHEGSVAWGAVLGSAASGAVALGLAVVYFSRKDY